MKILAAIMGAAVLFACAAPAAAAVRQVSVTALDPASGETTVVGLYRRMVGVVIGINTYSNLAPEQQLHYAVGDAQGIAAVLANRYAFDTIYTLFDEDATKLGIEKLLFDEVAGQVGPEDAVFFFFAGHGITLETQKYGKLGWIIPHDGSFDPKLSYRNISMEEIKNEVSRQIQARHIFYVIDACYSGLLLETRGEAPAPKRSLEYLRELVNEDARQVLTAGTDKQPVLDGGPGGHSVFTGRFIQRLENVSDYVTATELSTWLKERVYSDAVARGHRQTPVSGALWGLGDFVFVPRAGGGAKLVPYGGTPPPPAATRPAEVVRPARAEPQPAARPAPATSASAKRIFIGTADAIMTLELTKPF